MEPLPPVKEVEYRCYISKIFEELSGKEYMTFGFETAKEFSSFRYEIAVRYRIQPNLLEFKVLGMTATRTMMPAFGTARSVLKIPLLPFGVYTVKMIKSDGIENVFEIEVTKRGFQILQPIPRKRFIDLVIETKAAAPGARHTSTVSKAPTIALVPRTIQKRQLTDMPEGEAMEELMEPETQEERERREEAELFGGSNNGHSAKAGAKHAIEEVNEVPANGKHNGKEEPKSSKAPAKKESKPAKNTEHKPAKVEKKPAAKAKPAAKNHAPAKKVTPQKPAAKAKPKAKPKPAAKKNGKKK